jgi:hypothetical protein
MNHLSGQIVNIICARKDVKLEYLMDVTGVDSKSLLRTLRYLEEEGYISSDEITEGNMDKHGRFYDEVKLVWNPPVPAGNADGKEESDKTVPSGGSTD